MELLLLACSTGRRLRAIETSLKTGERVDMRIMFHSPKIGIHPELSNKQFRVQVKCRYILRGDDGRLLYEDQDFRGLESDVKYTVLLSLETKFRQHPTAGFPSVAARTLSGTLRRSLAHSTQLVLSDRRRATQRYPAVLREAPDETSKRSSRTGSASSVVLL